MTEILQRYLTLFDELNILGQTLSKKSTKVALDDFVDFLIDAYVEGFAGASYFLGVDNKLDNEKLSASINIEYDGVSIFDKFVEYHEQRNTASIQRLMESEVHRVYNSGSLDGAEQSGKNIIKRWITVGDDVVRDTHRYLEEKSVPLSEFFTTFDGDSALYPGGFANAENNANCRCMLRYDEV